MPGREKWHFIPLLHLPSQGGAHHHCIQSSSISQVFPWAPQAQKSVAKCHGLDLIIPERQTVRASSILGICLGCSQQWSHQQQRSSSVDRHSHAKTSFTPPWFIWQAQAGGWKLHLAILCRGAGVTWVNPLALLALVAVYCPLLLSSCRCLLCRKLRHKALEGFLTMEASANLAGLAFQGSALCLGDTS